MNSLAVIRRCAVFAAVIIGVYVLRWAQDILMPLVIAVLLADLLIPVVTGLVQRRVPNGVAVTLVTCAVALAILAGLLLVSRQVLNLTAELPNYRGNIVNKVRSIHGHGGAISRLTGVIDDVQAELAPRGTPGKTNPSGVPATGGQPTTAPKPVPVQVVQTPAVSTAADYIAPVVFPLTELGIVLIYLFFLMLNRDVIGHRFRWLLRKSRVAISQNVIDDASRRVTRYLRAQLLLNTCYAALTFVILSLFGLPNALLLAVVAAALRYVPYVGPVIAISLPTLLGIAVFEGWLRPLAMLAAVASVEGVTGGVIEPLVYGSSTGVSSIGVVFSSFFWGWVWGPVGLILALPLTVWIVIVGRYLPGLRPLSILLSSEPVADVENEDRHCKPAIVPKVEGWAE
jgi:predicted PurR-regulated permease PerM